ncbi:MAG: motility-associated protein [Nitrospiraceae bacterium]
MLFIKDGLLRVEHQTIGWTHEFTSEDAVFMEVDGSKLILTGASPSRRLLVSTFEGAPRRRRHEEDKWYTVDIATVLGIVIAIGSILGGQALEGGHAGSIMQLTAFIIVMGGTIGACCVQEPAARCDQSDWIPVFGYFQPCSISKGTITQILTRIWR